MYCYTCGRVCAVQSVVAETGRRTAVQCLLVTATSWRLSAVTRAQRTFNTAPSVGTIHTTTAAAAAAAAAAGTNFCPYVRQILADFHKFFH